MTPADPETLLRNLWPALGINLGFAWIAFRTGSVRLSGFVGGLLVGSLIYLCAGWRGFAILGAMFVIGTLLTRFGYAKKKTMGVAEEKAGARGASHAVANGGTAAAAALLAWWTGNGIWLLALTGALATAAMDTAGSEIGPLWGRRTLSLRTLRSVAPGTPGAVSLEGTLAGALAALGLGLLGWILGLLSLVMVPGIVFAALVGNLYEGILGSRGIPPHSWLNFTNTMVGATTALGLGLWIAS